MATFEVKYKGKLYNVCAKDSASAGQKVVDICTQEDIKNNTIKTYSVDFELCGFKVKATNEQEAAMKALKYCKDNNIPYNKNCLDNTEDVQDDIDTNAEIMFKGKLIKKYGTWDYRVNIDGKEVKFDSLEKAKKEISLMLR